MRTIINRFGISPGVFVPETKATIAAYRGQSHVHRMEHNVIDSVDVLRLVGLRRLATVTLEREVVLGIVCLHVLNGHASFDRAESEPGRTLVLVQKDAHTSVLKSKRTLNALHFLFYSIQF